MTSYIFRKGRKRKEYTGDVWSNAKQYDIIKQLDILRKWLSKKNNTKCSENFTI